MTNHFRLVLINSKNFLFALQSASKGEMMCNVVLILGCVKDGLIAIPVKSSVCQYVNVAEGKYVLHIHKYIFLLILSHR